MEAPTEAILLLFLQEACKKCRVLSFVCTTTTHNFYELEKTGECGFLQLLHMLFVMLFIRIKNVRILYVLSKRRR